MEDLEPHEFVRLVRLIQAVDSMFCHELGAVGTYFVLNDGPAAGQDSPHVHIHLWAREPAKHVNPFAGGLPSTMGFPSDHQRQGLRERAAALLAPIWPWPRGGKTADEKGSAPSG
jgi:diadenosine tetraphosphate (Ap4A) HIT family hydrolase